MATYIVKSGETLSGIGAKLGVDWRQITGFRSGDPNLIFPGEVLTIPGVDRPSTGFIGPIQPTAPKPGEPGFIGPIQPTAPTPTITADDLTTQVEPIVEPILGEEDIPIITPPVTPPADVTPPTDEVSDALKTFLEGQEPPTDPTIAFEKAREEAGILEKQEAFIESQKARKAAQSELDIINAQIADIVGQTQVRKLEIAKEPISAEAIRGRNIVEERRLAIQAIPLQAQALIAQARIASLQGDAEISQMILRRAEDRMSELFKMQVDYEQNLRDFEQGKIDAVWEWATQKEKEQLKTLRIQNEQDFRIKLENLRTENDAMLKRIGLKKEAPTVTGLTTAENTRFWSRIDAGKNELQQGESWGNVWNRVKTQFPNVSNEIIDNALGVSWREPRAFEEFKEKTKISAGNAIDNLIKKYGY